MGSNVPTNTAAIIPSAKAHPFQVQSVPLWSPKANEILIRNHAVAINPVDGNLQYMAFFPLNYPAILGQDVSGEVIAVGEGVDRFKSGDRVVGHAVSMATGRQEDAGFQQYTILQTNMVSHIPADMAYERACVLPLGLSTAASGLFRKEFLSLDLPTVPAREPSGKTVLVWGGASSVGSNAIQLLVASGYEVITTCSAKNFSYAKKLGASQVFDYNSPTVREDLIKAFEGKTTAGAFDSIGPAAWDHCLAIMEVTNGNKIIATCKRGFTEPTNGVKLLPVFGTSLKDDHIGGAIYNDFLPHALEKGSFRPYPEPQVVGEGLEAVQAAVDQHRAGVSATKLVVKL